MSVLVACEDQSSVPDYRMSNVRIVERIDRGQVAEPIIRVAFDVQNDGPPDPYRCTVMLYDKAGNLVSSGFTRVLAFTGERQGITADVGIPADVETPQEARISCRAEEYVPPST